MATATKVKLTKADTIRAQMEHHPSASNSEIIKLCKRVGVTVTSAQVAGIFTPSSCAMCRALPISSSVYFCGSMLLDELRCPFLRPFIGELGIWRRGYGRLREWTWTHSTVELRRMERHLTALLCEVMRKIGETDENIHCTLAAWWKEHQVEDHAAA